MWAKTTWNGHPILAFPCRPCLMIFGAWRPLRAWQHKTPKILKTRTGGKPDTNHLEPKRPRRSTSHGSPAQPCLGILSKMEKPSTAQLLPGGQHQGEAVASSAPRANGENWVNWVNLFWANKMSTLHGCLWFLAVFGCEHSLKHLTTEAVLCSPRAWM